MRRWLLPAVCAGCNSYRNADQPLCDLCLDRLSDLPLAHCPTCSLPYPSADSGIHLCGKCSSQTPPFSKVHALGCYEGFLRELIQRLKYHRLPILDRPLGQLLTDKLTRAQAMDNIDCILPVPLHPSRLRERTFNQSLLIARQISRHSSCPVAHKTLERTRTTQTQQTLNVTERQKNLKHAFEVCADIKGARLLLVDDVMTTGATARACTSALIAAGATEVRIAVLARAARYQLAD